MSRQRILKLLLCSPGWTQGADPTLNTINFLHKSNHGCVVCMSKLAVDRSIDITILANYMFVQCLLPEALVGKVDIILLVAYSRSHELELGRPIVFEHGCG